MIILDTNVVSEPMRPAGSAAVLDWLDRQVAETLYLTATSLSELLTGVEILPDGRRKEAMAAMMGGLGSVCWRLMRRLHGHTRRW